MATVNDIIIYCDEDDGQPQPNTFRLCPLGIQYYAARPLNECCLMDFTLALPGADADDPDTICCTGLVVQCSAPDNGNNLYRIWVKFMDLAPYVEEQLRTLCKECQLNCPFCENY